MPTTQGAALNEISVIGSLLIQPETLDIISAALTVSDFESEKCKELFRAALELQGDGEVIDAVTIEARARQNGFAELSGFIIECMQVTPTAANVRAYCKTIKQDSNLRRMRNIAEQIYNGVYAETDWKQLAAETAEQLADMERDEDNGIVTGADAINEWYEYYGKVAANPDFAYCRTGYKTLDNKLGGGMVKSGLYIVAGRPGMGKTTLGVNIAENVSKEDKRVLFISMEMSRKQVTAKRISKQSGVSYTKLINGGANETELQKASDAASLLFDRPFYISAASKTTVVDIGRAARQVKDVSLIVVDYLGLIRSADPKSNKPRYEEMTDISADLKALAKVLDIPIVVLCQLNRENNTSTDKRPKLHHLRDTGAIEQDADAVLLLHRPEYYAEKPEDYEPPEIEDFEIDVAKNRHGETGLVKMLWRGKAGDICEIDFKREEPAQQKNNDWHEVSQQGELPF